MDNVKEGPVISCVVVNPINNKLMGGKPGNATNAFKGPAIEVLANTYTKDIKVYMHDIIPDKRFYDGQEIPIQNCPNIYTRREMQKAIIAEQNKVNDGKNDNIR